MITQIIFGKNYLKKLKMFMNDCSEYQFNTDEFWRKIFDKTVLRSDEGENEFLDYFKKLILESEFSQQTTVFHGDSRSK